MLVLALAAAIGGTIVALVLLMNRRFPAAFAARSRLRRRMIASLVPLLVFGGATWAVTGSLGAAGKAGLGALAAGLLTTFAIRNAPTGLPRSLRPRQAAIPAPDPAGDQEVRPS